ncbi:RNA-directed DNA polymerase, eukaryota, reverse transcriptase zinc-binding domain protein [Tanacetum coccineum]
MIRGINRVKWNSILLDSKYGGLGAGCLRSKNLSLLRKWKWHFLTEENTLWRTVIKEFYGEYGGFHSSNSSFGNSGVWIDINKAIKNIEAIDLNCRNSFVRKVADEENTSLWLDPWCGDGTRLKDKKVDVMVWKASLDRLAMRPNLMVRGVVLPSSNCPFCDSEAEDFDHVLVKCHRVSGVWRKVRSWWNLPRPFSFPSFSIVEVAKGSVNVLGGPNLVKAMNWFSR